MQLAGLGVPVQRALQAAVERLMLRVQQVRAVRVQPR